MRAGRLLSILLLLQTRVRLTAEELAGEFSVSVRTIYRDIDELGAAGVPVFADRGPGGGFQLVAGYRTTLTGLGADEAEALLVAGVPGAADALGLGAAAGRAALKLLAALPSGPSASAGRLGARVHFDPVEWYHAAEPVPFLPLVARAVLDDRLLLMTYESWTGVRTHRVVPLGVVVLHFVVHQREVVNELDRAGARHRVVAPRVERAAGTLAGAQPLGVGAEALAGLGTGGRRGLAVDVALRHRARE